jgi:MFS transporter, DHA2 family, multidrug resistance protein
MAQASGLFNIMRQLGGSFGVAILATLLTTRVNYHTQMFGSAINTNSTEFKNITSNISYYIQHVAGSNAATAIIQGRSVINSHISLQSFIQGVNDDFLIAGLITILGGLPIFWLHVKKKKQHNKPVPHQAALE